MRIILFFVLVLAAGALVASNAQAATSASGSQSVTGKPKGQLEATFPGAYNFADWDLLTDNFSSEQTVNVKSNKSWGVKVSSDQAAGLMREWDGSAYVVAGETLGAALNWANTSFDGTPIGSPSYAALSSSQALVTGTKPKTGNAGKDVGVTYRQYVDYNDNADIGADTYRILVTFDAAQGF